MEKSKNGAYNKLTPSLRFKEFDCGWDNRKVGNLGDFKGGGTPPTDNADYWAGRTPWISSSDVTEDDVTNLSITRYLSDKAINESATKIIPKNSVLFVSRVGVGKLAVSQTDLCTSQDFANLIPTKDSSYFIAYYFIARNKLLHQYSQGTSIKGFTTGDLKNIPIKIPSLPEQQKIASFLSAVDHKIQLLTKKKELLEQYKKGVMQQLFSGQLRFKDEHGEEYPEWEEKRLGDLYSFKSTNSLSREKLNYESGSVYNIHYGDIHTKFRTAFSLSKEDIPYINRDVDLSKIKEDAYCKNGDLVMADASEDYHDIGKTIELIEVNDKRVLAGLHTFLIRPKSSKTVIGYFGILLKSWRMRKQLMVVAQGTKVLSLSSGRVSNLKLSLPSREEQQKITAFMSSIDNKIESVVNQITHTQTFKKGLLQQMFV